MSLSIKDRAASWARPVIKMWLVLVFMGSIVLWIWSTSRPGNYPPGPAWDPFIGNYRLFRARKAALGYHHLVWDSLTREYGPVVGLRLGKDLIVVASGSEAIREVLTREDFDGRPDGFFFRMRTFGKRLGIVFSDGKFWQRQRRFSLHHLRNFGYGRKEMEEQIIEETQVLMDTFRKRCEEGPVLMSDAFDVSVVNVLWAIMAGQRFDLEDARLKRLLAIVHDAFRVTDISGGLLNQMPFLRFVAPGLCGYKELTDVLYRMWNFLEETIAEHKKSFCATHARDFIDAFLQKMEVNKNVDPSFTQEQLISLCLDLFMAGSETTSNTLGFTVLYMIRYPDIQRNLQKEMDDVVGRDRWPNLQDRNKLVYVDAVLSEIQRIINVAPVGIAHRAVRDSELMGYRVPRGTTVLTNLYSIHMDREFWVDPHQFNPRRFLDGKRTDCQDNYFAPFGYGRRRCLGETLARANLFLFFTALFHNFSVSVAGETPSLEGLDGVTITPRPFRAVLQPRDD